MKLIDAGDYDDAYTLLRNIGNNEAVAANKYDRAMAYINAQDYEAAYTLLDGLNYEDSEENGRASSRSIMKFSFRGHLLAILFHSVPMSRTAMSRTEKKKSNGSFWKKRLTEFL